MRPLASAGFAILLLTACRSTDQGSWRSFGEPVPDAQAVKANELLSNPERYVGRDIVVEGAPKAVCPKKGCWMIFDNGQRAMRTLFKDHAFFVPLDSAGAPMRMSGTLTMKTISEADAKHFLEDEGKAREAAKLSGDQQELVFVARGVAIGAR
jgi:hypothetical protein